jgi:hypothetical protein
VAFETGPEAKWTEAEAEFQSILGEKPDDGPSRALWERCREYSLEEPPSNWDGVFVHGP